MPPWLLWLPALSPVAVLRVDNKIELVKLPWTLGGMFSGRYALQSGRRIHPPRWKQPAFDSIRATQEQDPVSLLQDGRRTLWYFHKCFYWDDEGLDGDDVKALVYQRERRAQQKLQTARSLMRAEADGRPTRIPIPSDLRRPRSP